MTTQSTPALNDIRWLVSPAAREWIAAAAAAEADVRGVTALRAHLTAERAHLVLEQAALRQRAAAKFRAAPEMFFTPRTLEQATDEVIARYKASRFPAGGELADLCCGIGGDLLALAERASVVGVERDPIIAILAEANAAAMQTHAVEAMHEVSLRVEEVSERSVQSCTAWHCDPDRRTLGRRSSNPDYSDPPPEMIDRLLAVQPNAAVKLAPAAEVRPHWQAGCALEWISRAGECRQAVAWFGALATRPGRRAATVLSPDGHPRTVEQTGAERPVEANQIGRYVFEPDAAVLAAHLTNELAAQYGLQPISDKAAYLTGEQPVRDLALAAFEALEVLPFDIKRLRSALAARNVGTLEIKKRGVPEDPRVVRRKLGLKGEESAILILTPTWAGVRAVIARRTC